MPSATSGSSSPPEEAEEDAIHAAQIGDINFLDSRTVQLPKDCPKPVAYDDAALSTLIPDSQLYRRTAMQEYVPTIEGDLRSFFSGMDAEATADMPMQFFDSFGQNLWFDQILDASTEYSPNSIRPFPDSSTRQNHLEDQLPQIHQSLTAEESPVASISSGETTVKISDGDHGLIQHFLTAMKQYSTKLLQGSEEDLNCLTFSNLGLFHAQLFHAMMAFAALHRAQTQDSFFAQAELRYQRATALLFEDESAHDHLDVTISTVWFLLQYELLFASGIVRFCNLLTHLARTLDTYSAQKSSNPGSLSRLGTRTLVWIAAYDVRALSSGGRGGYFLRSIENFLPLRVHLEEPASTFNGGPLAPLSVSIPASSYLDHTAILRLRLRCNILHGRILMLSPPDKDSDDSSTVSDDESEWGAVHASLIEHHDVFERGTDRIPGFPVQIATGEMARLPANLSSLRFSHLLSLSSLYAAFVDYYLAVRSSGFDGFSMLNKFPSVSPPHVFNQATIPSRAECPARMVRIAWFVNQNRRLSPRTVWPSLLLAAGIESVDGVHREWVRNALKQTETWSTHFLQTRVLLEAVYERQSGLHSGEVVDVLKIQSETTGPFIL